MRQFITHFVRIEPGKWACVRAGEFYGPAGRVQVSTGTTFTVGTIFMGFDLAKALEEQYELGRQQH